MPQGKRVVPGGNGWLLWFVILLLAGCAHNPLQVEALTEDQTRQLLSGEVFLDAHTSAGQIDQQIDTMSREVLALDDDMRMFVDTFTAGAYTTETRLRHLLRAIFHSGMLGLEYDPLKTYTATDTFYFQQGNCLSFTNMFVAMGREAGLKVWFNEVKVPPTWDMQSASTHVYYRHMNAVVQTRRGKHIVDLNMENYDVDYPQRKVSDDYALAQFFNNRAMELLFDNDWQGSFLNLRAAIELEPDLAFLWGNLGSLYRRADQFELAELAFRKALEKDPRNLMAMSNLGRLYRQYGQDHKAVELEERVVRHRNKNPYYQFHLAQQALNDRELEQALDHIHAAIKHYNKDHRFFFLAARINTALGNAQIAQKHLQRAADLTRDEEQKQRYHHKLDALASR